MSEEKEMLFGFRIHAIITILVSLLLLTINLISNDALWFYFPVLGMSFGLLIHRTILFYLQKANKISNSEN